MNQPTNVVTTSDPMKDNSMRNAQNRLADDPRFHRQIERVHKVGPRAIGELVLEIVRRWPRKRREAFLERLDRYAALDPSILRQLGGDAFPPAPLRVVPR